MAAMGSLELKFVGSLAGKVALVTGASRGIGKGIAKMLAEAGATVYITGRKMDSRNDVTETSLRSTAEEISNTACRGGGKCIPVECDHGHDADVESLFHRISKEQDGRLDVLVNNAFAAVNFLAENKGKKFYEKPVGAWDFVMRVGTRSNYVAAHYAANMMVPRKTGLIINISSYGGLRYLFDVPYGVGKEANDRMAVDMAIELKRQNIAVVSLWPGPVATEMVVNNVIENTEATKHEKKLFQYSESPTFTGKAVVALAADKNIMAQTGKVHIVADLATEYGFKDGGIQPLSFRQIKFFVRYAMPSVEWLIPRFLYLPRWMFSLLGNKL